MVEEVGRKQINLKEHVEKITLGCVQWQVYYCDLVMYDMTKERWTEQF
jgi:hypothetical protein